MASGAFQSGIDRMIDDNIDYTNDTIKVMLLSTATPYTFDPDDEFVSEAGANDPDDAETNVTGYTRGFAGAGRKTLASKTTTVVDGSNRVEVDAADVVWTALGAGETLEAAVVIKEVTNDAASPMVCYLDPTNIATNGSDVTLTFASNGFLNFNC
jgi:hypothetical protein